MKVKYDVKSIPSVYLCEASIENLEARVKSIKEHIAWRRDIIAEHEKLIGTQVWVKKYYDDTNRRYNSLTDHDEWKKGKIHGVEEVASKKGHFTFKIELESGTIVRTTQSHIKFVEPKVIKRGPPKEVKVGDLVWVTWGYRRTEPSDDYYTAAADKVRGYSYVSARGDKLPTPGAVTAVFPNFDKERNPHWYTGRPDPDGYDHDLVGFEVLCDGELYYCPRHSITVSLPAEIRRKLKAKKEADNGKE